MSQPGKPLRCLFFSVDVGAGHRLAAQALQEAIAERCPGSRFELLDALEHMGPGAHLMAQDFYLGIQKELPELWGAVYEQRSAFKLLAPLGALVDEFRAWGLAPLLRDFQPDLVVATHPFGCGLAGALRRSGSLRSPAIAVLTDFDGHPAWVVDGLDRYVVGSVAVARDLKRHGVPARQLIQAGIPLRRGFSDVRGRSRDPGAWGLAPDRLTLVLLGGGLGLGPVLETARVLGDLDGPLQLMLVAGRNTELESQAKELARHTAQPLHVRGYVEDMAGLLLHADLAITKPGGLTSAEVLAVGIPLIALQPLAGQEEANCIALCKAGVAVRARDASEAGRAVQALLNDPGLREAMRQASLELGQIGRAHV